MKLVSFVLVAVALAILTCFVVAGPAASRTATGLARSSAPAEFTVTPSAADHGWIDPQTDQLVPAGGSVSFTMGADPGYRIDAVYVDGHSIGAPTSYQFTNVQADHTIDVLVMVDSPGPYVLTPEPGPHGGIVPAEPQTVAAGQGFTFQIMPDADYQVEDVLVDGVSVGPRTSYAFTDVHRDHTLSATFALKTGPTYVLTPSAGEHGSILPDAPQSIAAGGEYMFLINADTGYHVADVLVDGVSVGPVTSYRFKDVRANHTLAATFAVNTVPEYVLTPSAGSHGLITPPGPQAVQQGGSFRFIITADAGYHVADVLVDGVSVGARSSYDFTDVHAGHTLSATFAADVGPVITVTGPGASDVWAAGSSQTVSWTLASAVATGRFRVFASSSAGELTELTQASAPVAAAGSSTSYEFPYSVSLPANDSYDILVRYESETGVLQSEARSAGGVRVTPAAKVTVSVPKAKVVWKRGAGKMLSWMLSAPVAAGEFRVWAVSAKGKRTPVTPVATPVHVAAGVTKYTYRWKVNVPAGAGYRIAVEYWWGDLKVASGTSPGRITVKK
jgi:hypothetical protein